MDGWIFYIKLLTTVPPQFGGLFLFFNFIIHFSHLLFISFYFISFFASYLVLIIPVLYYILLIEFFFCFFFVALLVQFYSITSSS